MTDTNNLSDGATINLEAACAIVCLRCKQGGDGPKLIDGVWVHTFPTVAGREVCGANDLRNLPSTEATHDARLRRALKRCGHRLNRAHAWAARWKALAKRQRGPLRLCHSGECNAAEWWRARWQEWSDWARAELEQAGITEPQQVRWGSHTQRERLSALLHELQGGSRDRAKLHDRTAAAAPYCTPKCETCLHCDLNHDCAPWCTLYGVGVAPRYGWSCRGYERRSGKLVRDHDGKETER